MPKGKPILSNAKRAKRANKKPKEPKKEPNEKKEPDRQLYVVTMNGTQIEKVTTFEDIFAGKNIDKNKILAILRILQMYDPTNVSTSSALAKLVYQDKKWYEKMINRLHKWRTVNSLDTTSAAPLFRTQIDYYYEKCNLIKLIEIEPESADDAEFKQLASSIEPIGV